MTKAKNQADPARDVINGLAVAERNSPAKMPHTRYTDRMASYLDVDECLMADGTIMYQCNSRYGNCMNAYSDPRAMLAHLKIHRPTSGETDKAKRLPNPDRRVYTPLVEETPAVPAGSVAALLSTPLDVVAADLAELQPRVSNEPVASVVHPGPFVQPTVTTVPAVEDEDEDEDEDVTDDKPEPAGLMLARRLDAVREQLDEIRGQLNTLCDTVDDIANDVEVLDAPDVELAAKAAKFDEFKEFFRS